MLWTDTVMPKNASSASIVVVTSPKGWCCPRIIATLRKKLGKMNDKCADNLDWLWFWIEMLLQLATPLLTVNHFDLK